MMPVAVVTGAAGGIGRASAAALSRDGFALALLDLDAEAVGRVAEELGSRVLPMACDVTHESSVEAAVSAIAEQSRSPSNWARSAYCTTTLAYCCIQSSIAETAPSRS